MKHTLGIGMNSGKSHAGGWGFLLIELMITIAILAIIVALAYPSYRRHVLEAQRSIGQTKLLEIMQAEERYFTIHGKYTTALKTELGYDEAPAPSDGGWYRVSAAACRGAPSASASC